MKVAIIGANGAVGKELQALCHDYDLQCFGSGDTPSYEGCDAVFFCVGADVARREVPKARKAGALCLDASTAFRNDPLVPLIVPEINSHMLEKANGLIASPNCTTTLMLLPLAPIHKQNRIRRIISTTFQAVSGAGYRGIRELEEQLEGSQASDVFPVPCAHNVFLHESERSQTGYCAEEEKMQTETQKILEDSRIGVSARCVRVPVFRAHSIALNVELENAFEIQELRKTIESAPGVAYRDDVTALDATGQKSVFCGNLRRDPTRKNAFELWICGDQLLKGAALNLYQLATARCLT